MKNDLKALGTVALIGFALSVLGICLGAYVVMIYVGMWHGHNSAMPTLSFVDAVYAVGLIGILTSLGTFVRRD
ncbi:hypothetical protein [Streptomyces sp. NPDC007094]|uniref:hypothetical protein n=1 Tax=Streptomyces sp. NPDC007094 TaxID=3155359 RepID=UPI003400478E